MKLGVNLDYSTSEEGRVPPKPPQFETDVEEA